MGGELDAWTHLAVFAAGVAVGIILVLVVGVT